MYFHFIYFCYNYYYILHRCISYIPQRGLKFENKLCHCHCHCQLPNYKWYGFVVIFVHLHSDSVYYNLCKRVSFLC